MGYAGHGRFNMLESAMLKTRRFNMLNELCRAEGTYIAERTRLSIVNLAGIGMG